MFKKVLLVSLVLSGFVFPQIAGLCFAATDDLEKADQLYQYVIGLWPEDQNNPIWPQMREAMTCIALGNDANAEAAIDKLLTDFSENKYLPVALNATGDIYRQFKNYEKATPLLQYVIGHWPGHEFAMWSRKDLAEIDIELGKSEAAEAAIEELLAELADYGGENAAWIMHDAAELYLELEKYEKARQVFEAAIEKLLANSDSENAAWIIHDAAQLYLELEKYEKARQLFQRVLDDWPGHEVEMWSLSGLATTYSELGNVEAAEAAVEKLLTNYEGEHTAWVIRDAAQVYLELKKYEKARQLFQRVLDNWPGHEAEMWSLSGVATSDSGLGNVEAADAGIEKLLNEFSGDSDLSQAVLAVAEPYYVEGLRKKGEGLDSQAKEYFQKVLAIVETVENRTPGYVPAAETCCWTGVTYQALGEYQKSIECFQKVVDDYPDHSLAWYALYMVASNYEDLKESGVISKAEADAMIKVTYEKLLENYPDCKVADIARRWLNRHNSK